MRRRLDRFSPNADSLGDVKDKLTKLKTDALAVHDAIEEAGRLLAIIKEAPSLPPSSESSAV